MRTHATVTETVKTIFPELMGSKASIHIPMANGLFRPEILGTAPEPSQLSKSDLVAVCLMHLWFGAGLRYADVEGHFPIHVVDLTHAFLSRGEALDGPLRCAVGMSTSCALWIDIEDLDETALKHIFPQGTKGQTYYVGTDRLIQKTLEAYDYELECVLRRKVREQSKPPTACSWEILIIPSGTGRPNHLGYSLANKAKALYKLNPFVGWDADEASRKAAREGVDPEDLFLGYSIFHPRLIRLHVQKRLNELG